MDGVEEITFALSEITTFLDLRDSFAGNFAAPDRLGYNGLHKASEQASRAVVELLLDEGLDPNAQTLDNGYTPLHLAARRGRDEIIDTLVERGAIVDLATWDGWSALAMAVWENDSQATVLKLIQYGSDVNHETESHERILRLALDKGLEDHFCVLIEHGANIATPWEEEWEALYEAARDGHMKVAKILLDMGAKPDNKISYFEVPLLWFAYEGCVELVNKCIDLGINPDAVDEGKMTALLFAASQGHTEVVQVLLKANASLNWQCSEGHTALHLAVQQSRVETVRVLLSRCKGEDTRNDWSKTPPHDATEESSVAFTDFPTIVRNNGAQVDINAKNKFDNAPLHVAAMRGSMAIIEDLIKSGATVDAQNWSGATPLLLAALNGHMDAAQLLVDYGSDPFILQRDEGNFIHHRGIIDQPEALKFFLSLGLDPNQVDAMRQTSLHLASDIGYPQALRTLYDAGGDLSVLDGLGHTPYYWISRVYPEWAQEFDLVEVCNALPQDPLGDERRAHLRASLKIVISKFNGTAGTSPWSVQRLWHAIGRMLGCLGRLREASIALDGIAHVKKENIEFKILCDGCGTEDESLKNELFTCTECVVDLCREHYDQYLKGAAYNKCKGHLYVKSPSDQFNAENINFVGESGTTRREWVASLPVDSF